MGNIMALPGRSLCRIDAKLLKSELEEVRSIIAERVLCTNSSGVQAIPTRIFPASSSGLNKSLIYERPYFA